MFERLCHAIESYTAIPYNQRPYPGTPLKRPAYQGSNPVSDTFSVHAIQMCAKYFKRACDNPDDEEARSQMLLAASYAAIGFGNGILL
jgi:hydroxyacid-oxoacid transhydrogenase